MRSAVLPTNPLRNSLLILLLGVWAVISIRWRLMRHHVAPLDRIVYGIDLHAVPLEKAIEQVCSSVGTQIWVDWKVLPQNVFNYAREPDNSPSRPVDARLEGVSLRRALDAIFCDGRYNRMVEIRYVSTSDSVTITAESALPLVARVYDVGDIWQGVRGRRWPSETIRTCRRPR